MFIIIYFIRFLHSVPQLQYTQQVMFNFRQGQIVGLAHFRLLQGLGKSTGKGSPWFIQKYYSVVMLKQALQLELADCFCGSFCCLVRGL